MIINDRPTRDDDPKGVMAFKDAYYGGKALIVLGGPSGVLWDELKSKVRPDVVLGGNGVCLEIDNLDFWMCTENMSRAYGYATDRQDEREKKFIKMFTHPHHARTRLISHRSWWLLDQLGIDKSNCVSTRRWKWEDDAYQLQTGYTLRDYGEGYLTGWLLRAHGVGARVRVGTVGLHLIHHAAILGVSEIYTIGFDLMFRDAKKHHWYKYPEYKADAFRSPRMFIQREYGDVQVATQWVWVETAQFLHQYVAPMLANDGIVWRDYSDGLLKYEELECAKCANWD